MRTSSAFNWSQNDHRLECIRGSPPDNTIHFTPRRRKASRCGLRSAGVISRLSMFAFQMSHITHLQLHRLCGMSTKMGKALTRPLMRAKKYFKKRVDIAVDDTIHTNPVSTGHL